MNYSHPLRRALLANATFSTLCAILLIAFPDRLGVWIGFEYSVIYQVLGVGLLVFSADLCHQATRQTLSQLRAKIASIGDFSWVAATAALLLFFPGYLSFSGMALLTVIALIVLIFGITQTRAIAVMAH